MNSSKILFVEDNDSLRSSFSKKLRKRGFYVQEAIDGENALKICEKSIPDIILLDLLMPGMNGFCFLRKIRTCELYEDIPVIILSQVTNLYEALDLFDLGEFTGSTESELFLTEESCLQSFLQYLSIRLQKGIFRFFLKHNFQFEQLVRVIEQALEIYG